MTSSDRVVVAAPEACWGMVDDHLLLFDPIDRRLHVLNDMAAMVWALTDGGLRISDLVLRLGVEYRVAPHEIEPEIVEVVDQLVEARLCLTDSSPPRNAAIRADAVHPAPAVIGPHTLGPYEVLGSTVYVDVADEALAEELERTLAPLAVAPGGGEALTYRIDPNGTAFDLAVNDRRLLRHASRPACLRTLLADLNDTPLDHVDDAFALHGAAAKVNGRIVVISGVHASGKSTLVAQLLERGHGYVADDAVVIGAHDLVVRPYHRPLSIHTGAQQVLADHEPPGESPARDLTWDIDPRTIGDGALSGGGRLDAVVFPIFRPGGDAGVRELAPIEVMHRLLRNAFAFPRIDQHAFAAMVHIANRLPAYELAHGGVDHLERIEELVAGGTLISL